MIWVGMAAVLVLVTLAWLIGTEISELADVLRDLNTTLKQWRQDYVDTHKRRPERW